MVNELVSFLKGLEANLPQTITLGDILFAKDTSKLFIDTTQNNQNIRVPIQSATILCWQDWT